MNPIGSVLRSPDYPILLDPGLEAMHKSGDPCLLHPKTILKRVVPDSGRAE